MVMPAEPRNDAYARNHFPIRQEATPMASVESFTTYYATCARCGWEGPDRESARDDAQTDAENHECQVGARA